jgi:hypothetical protein
MPKNILPPAYAKFETSGLKVQIAAGKNDIPALELKSGRRR